MNSALSFSLLLSFSFLLPLNISAQCGQNYDHYVGRIVKKAEKLPHDKTRIVFVGSSTFRLWDNVDESFPEYEVVNAGIGGSCFDDIFHYKEELISTTNPDILVIYEGDNDIVHEEEDGGQRKVFDIYSDAWQLLNWIQKTHPELPVFLLSPKPSPSRWQHVAKYKALNSRLEKLTGAYNYQFLDCWPWLTDNDGNVDATLFNFDKLHLNDKGNNRLGYFIAEEIRDALEDEQRLNKFIDNWHRAAATADSGAYFGAFYNNESIFQGTDGGEYWTAEEFSTWAAPYFRRESAWIFESFERHWYRKGNTLWFNERLDSPHMGKCRGVGVVQSTKEGLKIEHYSLSFEVPNEVVGDLLPLAIPKRIEVLKFQQELDDFYSDSTTSPLTPEERADFYGHEFFNYNPKMTVEAQIQVLENEAWFNMATSSGVSREYRRYAKVTFEIGGQTLELFLYQSKRLMAMEEYQDHLFLPFTDKTTGVSTYSTGRFIDITKPEGTTMVLDFNYAYNPYCAYTDGYSCPITPKENYIDIEINAGIKGPKEH
ncbi:MAG TPA: hypothetical protein DIT65_03885 [Cryomorphaceae bacterium]|nr:hypothetical protein [Cryomorphaceae bacterium]|tara:strand:+ start:5560 stop:7179 length:1620 start_codon:yes stop_codon:yes gene_type:complete